MSNIPTVQTGLARLTVEAKLQHRLSGRIGYLCHSASVGPGVTPGPTAMKRLLGDRLKALFAPQHGLATDAQDNMIESPHFFHSHYQLPVYSLYSETRAPTPEMLADIDTLVVDLQDNGARPYTYIWTMVLALEACGRAGVEVVVLDRPNPLGGERVEGLISSADFRSIIGWHPMPIRHGMTAGEIAHYAQAYWGADCQLEVIPMKGWMRSMYFDDTGLPWVMPSPNFPSLDTALVYTGAVIIEGTNLSEGRGTTRPFELIGHPGLDAHRFVEECEGAMARSGIKGCALRPATFVPTFDKYKGVPCHGFQLHVTDRHTFRPWLTGQWLLRELYHHLSDGFAWRQPPFEYVFDRLPIDLLNGTDQLRFWVEERGAMEGLLAMEAEGRAAFLEKREAVLLYE